VLLCGDCGLGRVDPLPSSAELDAWYRSGYRLEYKGIRRPSTARLWRLTRVAVARALDLAPRLPPSATTLDIGCGAGELVFMLRALGHQSAGFDPDANYMEWARQTLGPFVSASRIDDYQVAPASLDAVTMFHVLEHLRDPTDVLRRIAGWLRPGGLLVIEVPHLEATVQGPGHQFHKAHLHYFNQPTLVAAAARAGFAFAEGGAFDAGENLRCYFLRTAEATPAALPGPQNAARLLAILRGHRRASHYLSFTPYRRAWGRLRRTISERLHSIGKTQQQILDQRAAELHARLAFVMPRPGAAGGAGRPEGSAPGQTTG
jgi:SAM-dependent methyltransferase